MNIIDAPFGQEFWLIYGPTETFLIPTCDADLINDAGIDLFDISAFLGAFNSGC